MLGPILVNEGCKEMKIYGCLFTCLSSRAVYIESTNSLSTDAFIKGLRIFYQVEVTFESSELITAQILLRPLQTEQGIFKDEPQENHGVFDGAW